MVDNKAKKVSLRNPFTDIFFTIFFVAMLPTVLFGGRLLSRLTGKFELGPGWPELLQGVLGFFFLILLALRGVQLGKQRRKLEQGTGGRR